MALAAATALTFLSRLWGLAHSPWDWDEMQFSLALDQYDVRDHYPHPPGFPLFVLTARIFLAAGLSHFHSLQAVNLAAGLFLVPAMFFFCRELRMRADVSLIAALLLAFMPNVWFFGETAFSDVPSMVLVLGACGLLMRGCRSAGAYTAGAIVLGISAGFRPQNLLIGLLPALVSSWYQVRDRRLRRVLVSAALGAAIVAISYGAAAWASGGWQQYSQALARHQKYIADVDSFRSPHRQPLRFLADDFFIRPFRAPLINTFLSLLAFISGLTALWRRRWPVLFGLATFGPFAITAWLLLDPMSASRFSIGYIPLVALLAADGIAVLSNLAPREPWRRAVQAGLCAIGVAAMMVWTIPAIAITRARVTPPVSVVEWIRANVPAGGMILADLTMGAYAEFFLQKSYAVDWVVEGVPLAGPDSRPAWYLVEGKSDDAGAMNFEWERGRLWKLVRHRYFQTSVRPVRGSLGFGEGWYGEEPQPGNEPRWRWMGARSITTLPPAPPRARLSLRFFVPVHAMKGVPTLEVSLNGKTLERFPVTAGPDERSWDVDTDPRSPNILELKIDRLASPARDGIDADWRDLGLRLDRLLWLGLKK